LKNLKVTEDIMVVVGSNAQDYHFLFDAGAVAVFGPGTSSEAAIKILEILMEVSGIKHIECQIYLKH
jgi:methylmalonyl-CoA mutase